MLTAYPLPTEDVTPDQLARVLEEAITHLDTVADLAAGLRRLAQAADRTTEADTLDHASSCAAEAWAKAQLALVALAELTPAQATTDAGDAGVAGCPHHPGLACTHPETYAQCPACRAGLVTHDARDPLCVHHVHLATLVTG